MQTFRVLAQCVVWICGFFSSQNLILESLPIKLKHFCAVVYILIKPDFQIKCTDTSPRENNSACTTCPTTTPTMTFPLTFIELLLMFKYNFISNSSITCGLNKLSALSEDVHDTNAGFDHLVTQKKESSTFNSLQSS